MKLINERILVTGGEGFIGKELVRQLKQRGCQNVVISSHHQYDLTKWEDVEHLFEDSEPSVIFHLAAKSGGIAANRANPGLYFFENIMMGTQLLEQARRRGVKKMVCLGTVCTYPNLAPMPLKESDIWNGYPEKTNASYGLVKRMLLRQIQAYREQYDFNGIFFFLSNIYGPEDNFDFETSHVIPAMVRKFIEAVNKNSPTVVLWGDGSPTRELIYRDDAVSALIEGAENYESSEPLNLATGEEISMRNLAEMIKKNVGYQGRIVWDLLKPNGQQRRALDTSCAQKLFNFRPSVSLHEGLKKTIEWYRNQAKLFSSSIQTADSKD